MRLYFVHQAVVNRADEELMKELREVEIEGRKYFVYKSEEPEKEELNKLAVIRYYCVGVLDIERR